LDDFLEKRNQPRIDVQWPITIFTQDGQAEAETVNVSPDGISISCDEPLHLNTIYRMCIMPINHSEIEIRGRVVWSDLYAIDENDKTIGMGICFVALSDDEQKKLNEIIAQIS
jgi:hypothetical protein